MRLSLKDSICLWVFPLGDGRSRRFRVTWRLGLVFGLGVMLGLVCFAYMAGDYTRLQFVRAKNYLTLVELMRERERLMNSKQNLELEVADLKSVKLKSEEYEREISERLDQLAQIIESATALGVFSKDSQRKGKIKTKPGVGGAEIEPEMPATGLRMIPDMMLKALSGTSVHNSDLVSELDSYLEALKVIPLSLPGSGYVSSGYGHRISPFSLQIKMHQGIDFSQPYGSPIHVTADGVVEEVTRCKAYGIYVDVKHTDRITTRYAHMSKALVKPGQKVTRGRVIGLVGMSGHTTGPHIHYEVLVNGRQANPAKFLALADKLESIS